MRTTISRVHHFSLSANHADQRIDNYLLGLWKGVPRSHVYHLLRTGQVRVESKRVKPHYRLQVGDRLRLPPIHHQEAGAPPIVSPQVLEGLEAAILYEDATLLVLDKPASFASHGGSGRAYGVIEALRVLRGARADLALVHRLDQGTSGCLMVTKRRSMLRWMHAQLRERKFEKHYLALVAGTGIAAQSIRAPLRKSAGPSPRVYVDPEGDHACTHLTPWRTIKNSVTLVELCLETGRTHQIRVHCAHIGHPILGDLKYGGLGSVDVGGILHPIPRLCLHARSIRVLLPDQTVLEVEAPWPAPLEALCIRLGGDPV